MLNQTQHAPDSARVPPKAFQELRAHLGCQSQLAHVWNGLTRAERQIVLAAAKLPKESHYLSQSFSAFSENAQLQIRSAIVRQSSWAGRIAEKADIHNTRRQLAQRVSHAYQLLIKGDKNSALDELGKLESAILAGGAV